eukprot:gene330-14316_t
MAPPAAPPSLLSLLLLSAPSGRPVSAQKPVYCPVNALTSCERPRKCHPELWHGIDSLEGYEITAINDSAVRIHSLNGSFEDTV